MRAAWSLSAVAAAALLGCGGTEGDNSAHPTPVRTERPEIAFFFNGGYALGTADDRGADKRILTGGSRHGTVSPQLFTGVSWSPDGERLAFAGGQKQQTGSPEDETDVYVIDAEGGQATRVTDSGDGSDPLWSADGETIVFTRTSGGAGEPIRGSLWSVRPDGSNLTQLVEAGDWEIYTAGSFTADGSQLGVTAKTLDPNSGQVSSGVDLIEPDGSDQTQLIDQASDPAFSPHGKRLAFASDRDRNGELCYGDQCFFAGELYVANADGSDPERLTDTHALNEAHPSWLPDGSLIAYQRGKAFENAEAISVLEVNADGTCTHRILGGPSSGPWYADPAWRPSRPRTGGGPLRC
jgi:Tol biopolymer transport system component